MPVPTEPVERIDRLIRPTSEPALWFQGRSWSFADLAQEISRVAAAATATTEPGARIAVLSWNRPEYVAVLYGVPAAGRIVVPLNARLSTAELAAQIGETEAAVVIADASLRHLIDGRVGARIVEWGGGYDAWLAQGAGIKPDEGSPDDPSWLLFTSGTTGRAKGALLTHRSLIAVTSTVHEARPVRESDVYLYPFPLFHVSAHNILVQHRFGRPVVLVRAFEAVEVLDACRRYGVTTLSLAPTMIAMLLDHPSFDPTALATVRCIGYGASAVPLALLRRILATLDVDLSHSYGMTEAAGGAVYLSPDDHRRAAASAPHLLASTGKPCGDVELRIVDDAMQTLPHGEVGEIAIRAPQVMAGYWREPGITADTLVDGWLRTGDLGRVDDEGYLYVVDRKKDIIITGGENVSSREVEDALGQHPGVRSCAVVGVPDPSWGESVCAVVVPTAPNAVSEAELIEHCRRHLAGFKRPKYVVFTDELIINANGKVDKRAMRELVLKEIGRS